MPVAEIRHLACPMTIVHPAILELIHTEGPDFWKGRIY